MQFTQPPRQVPLSLRVANLFNGLAQIGWGVFGFGSIFFWGFVSNADFSFFDFRPPYVLAAGRVTEVENTNARINKQPVMAHHYKYAVAGETFTGTSYTTGTELSSGDVVTVEYKADDPSRSRIQGMRRKQFGPGVVFVTIFPLIGLGILIAATRMGHKRSRLLRDGIFTTGVLKAKRATNMTVNKRRVFALTFEFTGRDGRQHQTEANTSLPARLEDEAQEPLLYDPDNPSQAYLLDQAPSRPKLEMNGDLVGNPVVAGLCLILPVLVIGANALMILYKLK
jgi:uncharacterized protein DUF3592